MKKVILAVAFVFSLVTVNAQNGNDQNLIGKATGAAHECLTPYRSQGFDLAANVETTGICFVSGALHKVTFYTTVKCHTEPCPRPASILVATVYFDCDNNVSSVECNN